MSEEEQLALSQFLDRLMAGSICVRTEQEEAFVEALADCVVRLEDATVSLSEFGKTRFVKAQVIIRAHASRISMYKHEEDDGKTRWEVYQALKAEGWTGHTVTRRRRQQIKANPYRLDAEVSKHFFLEDGKLPCLEYLMALYLCAEGRRLEEQSVTHLQSQQYYSALLDGRNPNEIKTRKRRPNAALQAGLDLLAAAPPQRTSLISPLAPT
eukprot:5122465-Amphidinium_carterae.1